MKRWPTKSLPQLCRPKQWTTLSKKDLSPAGYPVYGANGKIGFADTFTHEYPTILIGCRGSCGTIHVTEPKSYANGNAMALDNLDTSQVLLKWAVYFFRHRGFTDVITGSSQPQITQQGLVKVEVPLPPLEEQQQIVNLLDEADELRKLRAQADRCADTLIPAIFNEMFGDSVTNPMKLPIVNLENLLSFRTGKLDSNAAVEGGKYPFFTCSRDDFKIDTYAFDCEALLLAGNNAVGEYSVKHYKGKFNAYQRTYVLTLLNPDHSYNFMQQVLQLKLQELKRLSLGTNTKYLTLGILKKIAIPLPPIPLQNEFAQRVTEIRELEASQATSRTRLDALFQSMLHRAFNGEL